MAKKPSPYNQAIHLLQVLKKDYPNYRLSQHISTAFADYGEIWGLSDEEMLFALTKYETELEFNITPEKEINKIIEEGTNLTTLFLEDDDEEQEDYE